MVSRLHQWIAKTDAEQMESTYIFSMSESICEEKPSMVGAMMTRRAMIGSPQHHVEAGGLH